MTSLLCPAEVSIEALCLEEAALAGIYFIQQGDAGPIKIGWSKNVRSRLAGLQTANPYPLRLLLVLDGEERDERRLHDWFGTERLNGEWFKSDGEVAAFIASKLAKPSPSQRPVCFGPRWSGMHCWGRVVRAPAGFKAWLCEGHLSQHLGCGWESPPDPSLYHKDWINPWSCPSNERGQDCRHASEEEPCWGKLRSHAPFERKPHYTETYCEAHHPVDGVYTLIASKAASKMAEVRAYADETAEHMERIYKRLADIAGCEWAYIPELAPSTEQIVKRIEGDAEAIASLRIYVFGEAGECSARDRVDTLLASLGGDLEG